MEIDRPEKKGEGVGFGLELGMLWGGGGLGERESCSFVRDLEE